MANRNNLQLAMSRVDAKDECHYAEERAEIVSQGERMLAQAEEAAQIEAEGERAIAEQAEAVKTAAEEAARKWQERAADAMRVVLREKARYGHDLTALAPHEAQAVKIIEGALAAVGGGFPSKQDDAFNTTSTPGEIAKGAAVMSTLSA